MKVVMVGEVSGTRDGRDWPPRGSVVDLPEEEAMPLLRGGMARPFVEAAVETAVPDVADVETRSEPLTKRRARAVVREV